MSDCEHTTHSHTKNSQRLLWAFVVIFVFMIVEAIGGVLSGSLALIADASHMLTDAFALALAASATFLARRPADSKLHFGYRRAQVLAAFVNGILMAILLFWIVFEAIRRFNNPVEIDTRLMFIVAVIGFLANAVAFFILHQPGQKDLNMRGAMLHVVGDLFGSAAAMLAAVVIFFTAWMPIDPLLSMCVAVLIGISAYRLLRDAGYILLEGAPPDIDIENLCTEMAKASPGIEGAHQIQISQLTPDQPRLTMHLSVAQGADIGEALAAAKTYLAEKYSIFHSTIQVEIGDECADSTQLHSDEAKIVKPASNANDSAAAPSNGDLAMQQR